ncbi:MAG: hypothetical protein ACOX8F_02255 [Sakamotonia sp.]|jgi:hypothetical protein
MSSLSVKNLKNYVILGIAVAAAYIFFQKDQIFLYRLIDGLFIGGMLPMILGCFRLAKYAGSFDLLIYSHKKLARSGKNSDLSEEGKDPNGSGAPAPEQLGSYSDYLNQKKTAATYKEPLLAGGVFMLASLFLTIAFY